MQFVAISGMPFSAVGQVLPRLSTMLLRSSENGTSSTFITELCQILPNHLFQNCRLCKLLLQLRGQPLHLLLEWFAVVFGFRRAHIAAWREDEAVRPDFLEFCGFAEARDVLIGRREFESDSPFFSFIEE